MFIFIRLLLAHYIGDFPLQLDPIFKMKQKGLIGGIPHALIIVLCCLVLSWPYLNNPLVWSFILFIGIIHLVQDSIKLTYNAPKYSFWTYLLDQIFHAGTIGLLFFTNLKDIPPPAPSNLLIKIYSSNILMAYLIALIFATYNGFYLIRNFKITFLNKAELLAPFERWYTMAERALIVSLFLVNIQLVYLLPGIMVARPIVFILLKHKLKLHKDFISLTDMLLGWGIALFSGSGLFLFQSSHSVY